MLPHQTRVIEEHIELMFKIEGLRKFIESEGTPFAKLTQLEQRLLRNQHQIMLQYSAVLSQRIEVFKMVNEDKLAPDLTLSDETKEFLRKMIPDYQPSDNISAFLEKRDWSESWKK